jgi:hypothetical protein
MIQLLPKNKRQTLIAVVAIVCLMATGTFSAVAPIGTCYSIVGGGLIFSLVQTKESI